MGTAAARGSSFLLLAAASLAGAARAPSPAHAAQQQPLRVPLRAVPAPRPGPRWRSLLALRSDSGTSSADAWRAHYRAVHNGTHAIEYAGELQVGNQTFSVIFDTGSDRLIIPGKDCISPACRTHRLYNASKSSTSSNISELVPREVSFGAGHVVGFESEDHLCLGGACALVSFVEALEESEQPFLDAAFDGVLGLSLVLRSNTTRKSSVLNALVDAGAIPHAQFSVFMAKDLHSGSSEISFGAADLAHAAEPMVWARLSEPGYWQLSLSGLAVGGQKLSLCDDVGDASTPGGHELILANGTNVSTFFGKMCCRTLEEFEHEERCQYLETYAGWRSKTADSGTVLAQYSDGRVAVRMHDGCIQKVPRKWLSLPNGCRGDGTIQAVLDTGSSLIMGPRPIVEKVLSAIGVRENCTNQTLSGLPTLAMTLHDGGHNLTLGPNDYMDVLSLADGVYCWPHFIAAPETGKGGALILGMPFLRAYYTTFDAEGQRVGFARAQHKQQRLERQARLRSVALHSRRPTSFDTNLAAALRTEHWVG